MADRQSREPETISKRQELKAKRARNQRTQRTLLIAAVAVLAIAIAAVIILPQIQAANAPVGTIVQITPRAAAQQVDSTSEGDPNAKIRIDVFEDFQCSSCLNFTQTVEPQLMQNEIASGQVAYVFHNFPFIDGATWSSTKKESHQAANAAMCAADQGRFWDYHDMLFANWTGENVGDFVDKRLVAFAQALNLDMSKFNACFNANTFKAQIDADYALGQKWGVNGTPSVFVNGKEVSPGYIPTYDQIKQAIAAAAGQ